jgi:hypothetical protein
LINGVATFTTSTLTAGTKSVSAGYGGDTRHQFSWSPALSQVVGLATGTSLASSPNPSVAGSPVTLTATVSPAAATGSVQFLNGAAVLGTANLASGQAQLVVSNLPTGSASLTAVYSGSTQYGGSTSAVLVQTVSQASSTTALSANPPSPLTYGQAVTLSASVTPASATGTVQFLDGTTPLGTVTISGSASLSVPGLAVGAHSITAAYGGDVNDTASTSAVLAISVNKLASSATLASSLNPATSVQGVTFTATVSPAAATGTVQFLDGSAALGTVTLSNGSAALALTGMAAGVHAITAVYSGDANDSASTSAVLSETITPAVSSLALTASQNPSTLGQGVALSATISPVSATGAVLFLDGPTPVGSAAIVNGSAILVLSTFSVGAHSITASYGGDANDTAAVSPAVTQVVNKIASSVVAICSQNPSLYQMNIPLSATVTPSSATGTVQFLDGNTVLGTAAISAGSATMYLSTLSVGPHSITAVYSGDANDLGSTSAAVTETVNMDPSTVTAISSLNPATVGQSITFSATVTPSAATGTVQFLDGSTVLGTATIGNGAAALTLSNLPVGSHSITAVYSGDANDTASTSAVVAQTVNKLASSIALVSAPNPSPFGQPVALTATVTPSTATGTVQFLDGSTALGSVTIAGGSAALSLSTLSVGSHSIAAVYSGDANDTASTSAAVAQTVNKVASSVVLSTPANPAPGGLMIVLSASVTPNTATGTVQFLDGTTPLGTVTIYNGVASQQFLPLSTGAHSITAIYSGDANFAASTSAVLALTVNKIATTVQLASTLNPSAFGQSVTLFAACSPTTVTGTIQFLDGTTLLGSMPPNSGSGYVTLTNLAVGAHAITAVYSGDADHAAVTSAVMTQTVTKAPTSVALTSSVNPSTIGQAVTFTASLSPGSATGTIRFLDGASLLASKAVGNGSASLSLATLPLGAHQITAVYSGDANDAASTSAVLTQTVSALPTSVALASSRNPSTNGQVVTFTATVSPGSATGTMQFLDGSAVLATKTIGGGSAALSLNTLPPGAHAITAVYSGDANDTPSTSSILTQTVNKAPASVALASSKNPSTSGQGVTFTATLTPNSATGTVQFLDGSTALGSATIAGGSGALSLSTLAAGAHSITAVYSGDANYLTGTSPVLTQTVNKAPTSVALASSKNPAPSGQSVTLTATVSPSSATGTVQFLDGTTVLGSAAVNGGLAALPVSGLSVGAHSLKAAYSGDTNYLASTSATFTQSVTGAACHVTYAVTSQWNVGFGTAITIKNTGTTPVNGWNLTWTWAGNQKITQSWNSSYSQSSANAKLVNASYNAAIAPGATITGIGFNASYSGSNPSPTAFSLNGTLCN